MISRFMIICVILLRTFVPSMTSMGSLTFKLEMLQYLANQRRCYVTMATNVLRQAFFKIRYNERSTIIAQDSYLYIFGKFM